MQDYPQAQMGFDARRPDRRMVLKAAATLLAASSISQFPQAAAQNGHSSDMKPEPLRKNMLGFMLAHEQFTVPQLVEFGEAAERAGFDSWPPAIISSPGNPMKLGDFGSRSSQ